jgi:hypothetical protein
MFPIIGTRFYNSIKVFIASPSGVEDERQITEEEINNIDRICRSTLGLRIECLRWEDMAPRTPLPEEGQIEDVIIRELVQKCNVFILILYRRYGTVEDGQSKSNTEREIDVALERLNRKGSNLVLLTYFRDIPNNDDQGDQEKQVRELRKHLKEKKIFFQDYKEPQDFRQKFIHDLYYVAIRFHMAVKKQRSLRAFWALGSVEEKGSPRVAIIYPALDREEMKPQKPDRIWLERLVPNVVFEDFKAINKVEKTLRIIGDHTIETHTSKSVPHEINAMNRVWICLPRNHPGMRQMENYQKDAFFRFMPRMGNSEGFIKWHPPQRRKTIDVNSPLSTYLELQRSKMKGGQWSSNVGQIIAKDYAVLARFSDINEPSLKDYFIAGIRGLGTWGAGWFIDRRYKYLLPLEDKEDLQFQLLLEVVYKNEHIHDVKDVSDKPASYFEKENDPAQIKKYIEAEQC